MQQSESDRSLPKFIVPKLRLFLSVDLVGSTAVKQSPVFPITTPDKFWGERELAQPWLKPIAEFYAEFGKIFERHWNEYNSETREALSFPVGPAPEFWKANGDELLYVKDLSDRRDLVGCIVAWNGAVRDYRAQLRSKTDLDLKSTAWTAGFPITNSEIVFSRKVDPTDDEFIDDPRLRMFCLLDRWHSAKSEPHNLVRDFIGPSLDTGFRLCSLATPRKMPISVEVAWLMSTATRPHDGAAAKVIWPKIRFSGSVPLRGVMRGKPYPNFWIDVLPDDPLANSEDKLLRTGENPPHYDISMFCDHFFSQHETQILKPFIPHETQEQYGKIPQHFMECVQALHRRLCDEQTRYREEKTDRRDDSQMQPVDIQLIDDATARAMAVRQPKAD